MPALAVGKATTRADPQASIAVHVQRADEVVRESIGRGVGLNLLAAQMVEPVRCTDPKRAISIRDKCEDDIAHQAILSGEVAGLTSFITEEAVAFTAQPYGSISGLRDCGNGITRKRRQ